MNNPDSPLVLFVSVVLCALCYAGFFGLLALIRCLLED